MEPRAIAFTLAATSTAQLIFAELLGSRLEILAKEAYDKVVGDAATISELGLPPEPAQRKRLTDELYSQSRTVLNASAVAAALVTAVAGLIVTFFIARDGKEAAEGWTSLSIGAAAFVSFICLVVQLVRGKIYRYAVDAQAAAWLVDREQEPHLLRRGAANLKALVKLYRQQVKRLDTLTPFKTSVIIAAVAATAVGLLL